MKPILLFFTLLSFTLFIWSGCTSSSPNNVLMPPAAPKDRIQSEIFPNKNPEDSLPEAVQAPTPLPEGISLVLNGNEVDLTYLEKHPPSGEQTVLVRAHPSTPYAEVVTVMDRLHELGFMIAFAAKE